MASLNLPTSGRVYPDASTLIYSIERHPIFSPLLDPLWEAMVDGSAELITSELTILECLVAPIRAGDRRSQDVFDKAFDESGLQLLPVNRVVLRLAAELRATNVSLRTPDAIHLAVAEIYAAQWIVTNDRAMRGKSAIPVVILSDFVTNP
jgi:predicted nucleic acid-binding protein